MMSMDLSHSQEKLPEWMLTLESKRKKQHRLAHEIGAGAPCFVCGDSCPGLDLHFWRKLCRNCKCKKEDHDVKDDEGYEQFEILLGSGNKKIKKGGVLKIKLKEDADVSIIPKDNSSKGISFDWLPPNVTEEVATEYMQQLPAGKLPISGSDGALYRRQQLIKQVPLHDLDARHCHNLTPQETDELVKYLDNLKSNVFGQGCVGKLPSLYLETKAPLLGAVHVHQLDEAGRSLASSQSADSIRPLPPMPFAYNSVPRPFHASSSSSAYGSGEDEVQTPPPLPTSLPPRADLKIPSEFITDWHFPDDKSVEANIIKGIQDVSINQKDVPVLHRKDINDKEFFAPSVHQRQLPQFADTLPQSQHSFGYQSELTPISNAFSQASDKGNFKGQSVLENEGLQEFDPHFCQNNVINARDSSEEQLHSNVKQLQSSQNPLNSKHETCFGIHPPANFATTNSDSNNILLENSSELPTNSLQVSSLCPGTVVNSSSINADSASLTSEPLLSNINSGIGVGSSTNFERYSENLQAGVPQQLLHLHQSVASSEPVSGVRGIAEPLKGEREKYGDGVVSKEKAPYYVRGNESMHSQTGYDSRNQSLQDTHNYMNYPSTLPVEGVKTSFIVPQTLIESFSVSTDALPKSAQMMQHVPLPLDPSSISALSGSTGPLPALTPGGSDFHLDCRECGLKMVAGDVAVFAERAGNAAWHPSCFVCSTCKELLVDLMYFYHRNKVYCGRHYAELMGIPRCFACDELIFVKEHTVAEGKAFHVKHFCCYECDDPLGGKQYIPVDGQPVCLECYDRKYGKKCHTCKTIIAAGEQRVGWKHLNWHVQGNCFRCFECTKSLLGGRFIVKDDQPFCSRECFQTRLQKMAGAA